MSTKTRRPLASTTSSVACGASSTFIAYWKPEQPPGTTRTRSPPSPLTFSASINFFTSLAAVSVSVKFISSISFCNEMLKQKVNDGWRRLCAPACHKCSLKSETTVYHRLLFQVKHGQRLVGLDCLNAHLRCDVLRDLRKGFGLRAVGLADDDGHAQIATFADAERNGNAAQEGQFVTIRQRLAATVAKDEIFIAVVRALEIAHVF